MLDVSIMIVLDWVTYDKKIYANLAMPDSRVFVCSCSTSLSIQNVCTVVNTK